MGFGIIDKIKNIGSNGAANLVEKLGDAVDKNTTTKEEAEIQKAEFQKIVNEHIEKMTSLQNEEIALEFKEVELKFKDIDNARSREIAIATSDEAPLINKIIQPIMAIGTVLLTFILFYIVLFKPMGTEKDIIIYILGALTAITGQVFSYYFGSSSGSSKKAEQLDKLMNK